MELDDLDDKSKEIAELIGLDKFLKLSEVYGGTRIYLNKMSEVIKSVRDKRIKKEYNRYNLKALAVKYDLTEERIKQIVREKNHENQLDLFEYMS
jgi:Mor family transcriptional regulator